MKDKKVNLTMSSIAMIGASLITLVFCVMGLLNLKTYNKGLIMFIFTYMVPFVIATTSIFLGRFGICYSSNKSIINKLGVISLVNIIITTISSIIAPTIFGPISITVNLLFLYDICKMRLYNEKKRKEQSIINVNK